MKQGDFTELASSYHNRAGYSLSVLKVLAKHAGFEQKSEFQVADVGAGTGKLTENLIECGFNVVAVEPNDSMRSEGMKYTKGEVEWRKGSGEETGLPTAFADWLLMGSAFHWVDLEKGLKEFHRVLKKGGYFTALWNPRDLQRSEFHMRIEEKIRGIVPELKRVSSGSKEYTENLEDKLVSTGHFEDVIFIEARHEVSMTPERYLGAWRSVNDIQAQAGPERFEKIMMMIENEVSGMNEVVVPYKTRSWTCRAKES